MLNFNEKILLDGVNCALSNLYSHQSYLIENKVHERSIVFWFGVYLYEGLKNTEYSDFNLDFEYSKDHSHPKRTRNFPKGTYPDLILHKRGSNNSNILIIEFKTWWNNNVDDDIQKLKDFTNQNDKYKYKMGLSIILNKEKAQTIIIKNRVIQVKDD